MRWEFSVSPAEGGMCKVGDPPSFWRRTDLPAGRLAHVFDPALRDVCECVFCSASQNPAFERNPRKRDIPPFSRFLCPAVFQAGMAGLLMTSVRYERKYPARLLTQSGRRAKPACSEGVLRTGRQARTVFVPLCGIRRCLRFSALTRSNCRAQVIQT